MKSDRLTYLLGTIMLILCISLWIFAQNIPEPADIYPKALLIVLGFLTILMVIHTIQSSRHVGVTIPFENARFKQILIVTFLVGAYLVGMVSIGFYVSSFIFMILGILYLEEKRTKTTIIRAVVTSLVTDAIVFLAFNIFLSVPTPTGLLI